jgi:lysophospholipase L1-like esterase
MRIAFFGDSLTEGKFGVSFIDSLKLELPSYELLNYGEGGDTVISLYRRISQMQPGLETDLAFIWIGVNDVFGQMTWIYRLINAVRKKPYASNRAQFSSFYRTILDLLLEHSKMIITIPPLFLGEDLNNKWNRKLDEFTAHIRALSDEFERVEFADLREAFMERLEEGSVSSYLPTSMIRFARDKSTCSTIEEIDRRSSARGLAFTLDGVHLNSTGAELVAGFFRELIERVTQSG